MWAKLIISSRWRRPSNLTICVLEKLWKKMKNECLDATWRAIVILGNIFLYLMTITVQVLKLIAMLFDFNTHDIVINLPFLWGYGYRYGKLNRQGQRIPPMTFATAGTVRMHAQTKRCTWWLLRYPGNPCDRGQDTGPLPGVRKLCH